MRYFDIFSRLFVVLCLASCDGPPSLPATTSADAATIAAGLADSGVDLPHDKVALDLDLLRALGASAGAAGPILGSLIRESAPVYRGRGPNEATRLRGYVLATLADVGPPPEVLRSLREILLLEQSPYLLAAAARVAGTMGPKAASVSQTLDRIIAADFADDLVCLDAYNVLPTKENGTTARAEALRARARIGTLAESGESCCDVPIQDSCCSEPAVPMLAEHERRNSQLSAVALTDQDGSARTWEVLFDRPTALCFFYTQCDNPRKCSSTVSRMASLQRALKDADLADRTRVVLMTLDPAFDTNLIRRRYAEVRGFEPSSASVLASTSDAALQQVVSALGVNANFGQGRVSIHGVEIFVLDSHGRVAKRHRGPWSEKEIVEELAHLVTESPLPATRPSK